MLTLIFESLFTQLFFT